MKTLATMQHNNTMSNVLPALYQLRKLFHRDEVAGEAADFADRKCREVFTGILLRFL
jgi:hypothetical protein